MKAPNQNPDCKECGKPFKRYNTIQNICVECSIKIGKDNPTKITQKVLKQAESEQKKEVTRNTAWYLKHLQDEVNLIARLIDKDCVCISNQKPIPQGECHGGHRWNTADYKAIRFNLHNIHAQSAGQNTWKRGNADGYNKGLLMFYGQDYLNMVLDLPNKYTEVKHMRVDLERFYKAAQGISKFLKLENKTYSPQERIELRNKFNKMIAIYDTSTNI
jgi:hypothetical protein